ncbi:MAG: FHA domain-containing protein [Thermoguttaceae bacterium]|nr:FHA domain-containing protein [Thermoguttaceae bacterium]
MFHRRTPAMARLFVTRGVASTDCVSIPLPCLIGRGQDADLFVDSMLVSRRHCLLDLVDGKVHITDLGSRNGTLVNGQYISENVSVELDNQNEFSVGSLTFELEFQPTELIHDNAQVVRRHSQTSMPRV